MKPVIALVGRPNVGKSTLFNRMTKSRDAIVADFAGLTRDRHYGDGRLGDREFIVVDTGGFEPTAESGIVKEMAKQTRQAVAEADAVIFVVDVRGGAVGAGPRHRAASCAPPARRWCWRPTRPRAWPSRRCSASSTSSAWASRIRCRRRTGRACAA